VNKKSVVANGTKWAKISLISLLISLISYLSIGPYGSSANSDQNTVILISGLSFLISLTVSVLCGIAVIKLKK